MVVNRKQPTVPQAVSRSASTQHVPTKRHPKPPPKQDGVSVIDSQASKAATNKNSKTHAKKRRPKTWVDRLFLLALSLFTCYAFYTCRPNPIFSTPLHSHTIDPNPLCRSLHGYRVHILEPYVIPSVKHTLSFTHDLAEPYIAATQQKVAPYVAPVARTVNTAKPYVIRAVRTSKAVWKGTLVPFYKGTIKHYYIHAILPRYQLYIQPRLAPLLARAEKAYVYYVSRPLHIRATQLQRFLHSTYHSRIAPHIACVEPYVVQAYTTVCNLVLQATTAYNEHVHPRLIAAWVFARPHLCTAWKYSKATGLKAAEIGAEKLTFAAREAGTYRRAYVDPHVHKIWEKVAEGTPTATPVSESITTPPDVVDVSDTSSETTESTVGPTSVTAAEDLEPMPILATPVVVVEATTLANPAVPTPEEAADAENPTVAQSSTASSSSSASANPTSSAAPAHTDAPAAQTIADPEPASSIAASEPITPSPTPSAEASSAMKSAASIASASLVGSVSDGEDEDDLDGFLADLGIEDSESLTSKPTGAATPTDADAASTPAPDPAQVAAERLKVTAEKRANIVDRHEKWFDDLDALIANETQRIVVELAALREAEVDRLHALVAGGGEDGSEKKVNDMIEALQKEGEKLLKGLEGYLRKAASRSSTWKLPPPSQTAPVTDLQPKKDISVKEKEKWAKVLAKVEEKFALEVQSFRVKVHQLFVEAREKEVAMVVESKRRVKDLAETAQADLGLDYAWLDDVTFVDWQRYHELMGHHDEYEQVIHSIQNGTSTPVLPEPLDDPLLPALDALDKELQDVITGFSVALAPIRSGAARIFSVRSSEGKGENGEEDEEDSGFFVVRDGEVRRDDFSGVDVGKMGIKKKEGAGVVGIKPTEKPTGEKDDEVKILPISPPGGGEEATAHGGNSIFVGKDRVQVEQALGGVPLEPAVVRHEEL